MHAVHVIEKERGKRERGREYESRLMRKAKKGREGTKEITKNCSSKRNVAKKNLKE